MDDTVTIAETEQPIAQSDLFGAAPPSTNVAEVKKSKKPKQEILPNDPLSKAAHLVENLKAPEARVEAKKLIEGTEFDSFKLGGVLAKVHQSEYWKEYGFDDFRSYVETEHGMGFRKAMYLISIYWGVLTYELTWADVEGVGWTKLKVLLNPSAEGVVTAENIHSWLAKAKTSTVIQLEAAIKGALKGPETQAQEQDAGKTITKMTFNLHEDQKVTIREALEKAKEAAGTEFDTVGLEMMALEYLGKPAVQTAQPASTETVSLPEQMKAIGWEATLAEFEKIWPKIEITVDLPETP